MEMSIPCCICAPIPKDGNIRCNQAGHRGHITEIVSTEGSGDNSGRGMPRSYTYAHQYSTQVQRIANYGVLKGKKQFNDIRQACEAKIQVWESAFLGQRILWALYIRKTSKRNCFRLGGQPATPVTIWVLSSIYSAIRRNSSAYLNFTLILPPS